MSDLTALLAGVTEHSFVDGEGTRYVVFFQGCPHGCIGCHNPETHDMEGGKAYPISEVIDSIKRTRYLDGITLSGGDPLMQPEQCLKLIEAAHEMGLDVWLYTGWTIEAILSGVAGEKAIEVVRQVDVLVDGPFVMSKRDENCEWRGSKNQRVLRKNQIIEIINTQKEKEYEQNN